MATVISIDEVVAILTTSEKIGELTALWTAVAFERAGGDVEKAKKFAEDFGVEFGYDLVMRVATEGLESVCNTIPLRVELTGSLAWAMRGLAQVELVALEMNPIGEYVGMVDFPVGVSIDLSEIRFEPCQFDGKATAYLRVIPAEDSPRELKLPIRQMTVKERRKENLD